MEELDIVKRDLKHVTRIYEEKLDFILKLEAEIADLKEQLSDESGCVEYMKDVADNYEESLQGLAKEIVNYFKEIKSYESEDNNPSLLIKANEILEYKTGIPDIILKITKNGIKENKYDADGDLMDLDVGDYIVTKNANIRQITSDDMPDLKSEDIVRFAKEHEISLFKICEGKLKAPIITQIFNKEFTKEDYENRVK